MAKIKSNAQVIKTNSPISVDENLIPLGDKTENNISKYSSQLFGFFLILTGIFIFKDYLFGKAVYLFKDIGCDSLNISYPKWVMLADYIKKEGMPSWSFSQGMGQNIYPFWFDPFYAILSFFDKDTIIKSVVWINWFELIVSGIVFRQYLRVINISNFASILGGLCYAYCAYAVVATGWANRFGIELVSMALLLLALEYYIQQKSWWLLPLPIALLTIDQPFNLYPFGIFILVYTVIRHGEIHGKFSIKLLNLLFQIAAIATLGVFMASFISFSNLLQLIESPRVSGGDSYSNGLLAQSMNTVDARHLMTWITRMFSTDLIGTGMNKMSDTDTGYQGWSNYLEAPMFYVGLVFLLAIPQLFNFLTKRQKILYSITLGLCFLPLLFPFFRYAFWAFTGDYYRTFGLIFGVVILRFGTQAISFVERKNSVNKLVLSISLVILIGLLFIPYTDSIRIDKNLRALVVFFLIVNALLIVSLSRKSIKTISQISLIVLTCTELVIMASRGVSPTKRLAITASELKEKIGFNDYTDEAVAYLKQIDTSFYRIQKSYSSSPAKYASLNESSVQNFYGTQSYNSFNQMNYVRFMQNIGVGQKGVETSSRWVFGVPINVMFFGLVNVKYLLANESDISIFKRIGLDSIRTVGNIKVLKSRYSLPLGYTYSTYTTEDDFEKAQYSQLFKSKALLKACVVDKSLEKQLSGLQKITRIDTSVVLATTKELDQICIALKADSLKITKFSENKIVGNISLQTPKLLYLSIPYDRGWHALVDGKEASLERIQWGLTGLVLGRGQHTIELNYTVPFRQLGSWLSLLMLVVYGGLVFYTRKKIVDPQHII